MKKKISQGELHCLWDHIVDSRHQVPSDALDPDNLAPIGTSEKDSGTVYIDPINPLRAIERGQMLNPRSGKIESHEEIWLDEDLPPGTGVQFWEHEDGKAFVGTIGAHMVGIGMDWAWRLEREVVVYSFGGTDKSMEGSHLRHIEGDAEGGRNGSWIIREVWQT
jgi:hypothetical protein